MAARALEVRAFQPAAIALRAHQRPDPMAAGIEFVNEIGADKPGGAGDKTAHGWVMNVQRLNSNQFPCIQVRTQG